MTIIFSLRNTFILMIIMGITMIFVESTQAIGTNNRSDEKRLYIYNSREISAFFEVIGYQDFVHNVISRNSDGTALRFLNEKKKKIVIAECNGEIEVVDIPGYPAWLNDTNQIIAWLDEKSIVHYKNGMSEKMPFYPQSGGPDPSGKYFIKKPPDVIPINESCNTNIYSSEKPFSSLVKVNLCAAKIFYKDKKVFLTGITYFKGNVQDAIYIFEEKGDTLEKIDSAIINRPRKPPALFYAEDLSPWSDDVLYLDYHDFPGTRSIWYSFNLKTHQLNKVGTVSLFGGCAFYLQCDILRKVAEEQKKKNKK